MLTSLALALHNAPEGLAVGFSAMQPNFSKKLMVAGAISLHNIPEGIAVAAAMYNATGDKYGKFFALTHPPTCLSVVVKGIRAISVQRHLVLVIAFYSFLLPFPFCSVWRLTCFGKFNDVVRHKSFWIATLTGSLKLHAGRSTVPRD